MIGLKQKLVDSVADKSESAIDAEEENEIYESDYEYEYDDASVSDNCHSKSIETSSICSDNCNSNDIEDSDKCTDDCNSNCIESNSKCGCILNIPNDSSTSTWKSQSPMDIEEENEHYKNDETDDDGIIDDNNSNCSEASSIMIDTVDYPILKKISSCLISTSVTFIATDYQLKMKFKKEETLVMIIINFSRTAYDWKISALFDDIEYNSIYSVALRNTINRLILLYIIPDLDLNAAVRLWKVIPDTSKYHIDVEELKDISAISQIDHSEIVHGPDRAYIFIASIELRIKQLAQYCVTCSRKLQCYVPYFVHCNDLCKEHFQRLGLFGIKELVDNDWLIADIKLNIYYNFVAPQALAGYRAKLNLPIHIVEILLESSDKDTNDPAVEKQLIEKITDILNNCGTVDDLSDITDRGQLLLISWILSSYHLIDQKIQDKESKILCFNIHSSDYNKYVEFSQSDVNPPITVFHGSKPYAWANIFQNGLMNMSATEFMTSGASLGNGIYTGLERSVSESFTVPFTTDRKGSLYSLRSKRIMLECTLNNHFDASVASKHNNIYVVKAPQYLMASKVHIY